MVLIAPARCNKPAVAPAPANCNDRRLPTPRAWEVSSSVRHPVFHVTIMRCELSNLWIILEHDYQYFTTTTESEKEAFPDARPLLSFDVRAVPDQLGSSFPRKRESRASDMQRPPVHARGRPWAPAFAGATNEKSDPFGNCSMRHRHTFWDYQAGRRRTARAPR